MWKKIAAVFTALTLIVISPLNLNVEASEVQITASSSKEDIANDVFEFMSPNKAHGIFLY